MPMPALYVIPQDAPNAFATGRSPDKAAVAVTAGITQLLSPDELRGVIAHELAHIRNRDTLIQSVAAAIGGAITYLGYMLLWFGGDDESPLGPDRRRWRWCCWRRSRRRSSSWRSRASASTPPTRPAPRSAATPRASPRPCCGSRRAAKAIPMKVNEATECLYIVKPLSGARRSMAGLFSTHPPIEERVRRLRQMRPALG